MNFKKWINESVTFKIDGLDQPQDLLNLTWSVASKVLNQFRNDFANKDIHEIIAVDGLDVGIHRGIVNFYIDGLREDLVKKVLQAMLYYFVDLGGTITSDPRLDTSNTNRGRVYRIGVEVDEVPKHPELNVNNVAARDFLNMLNIDSLNLHGKISVRDLSIKLSMVNDFMKKNSTRKSTQGDNWLDFGTSIDQIERYISTLENMIKVAIEKEYDYIRYESFLQDQKLYKEISATGEIPTLRKSLIRPSLSQSNLSKSYIVPVKLTYATYNIFRRFISSKYQLVSDLFDRRGDGVDITTIKASNEEIYNLKELANMIASGKWTVSIPDYSSKEAFVNVARGVLSQLATEVN